jgi:hypothetical protein
MAQVDAHGAGILMRNDHAVRGIPKFLKSGSAAMVALLSNSQTWNTWFKGPISET